jgi:hypothetical protein
MLSLAELMSVVAAAAAGAATSASTTPTVTGAAPSASLAGQVTADGSSSSSASIAMTFALSVIPPSQQLLESLARSSMGSCPGGMPAALVRPAAAALPEAEGGAVRLVSELGAAVRLAAALASARVGVPDSWLHALQVIVSGARPRKLLP